jgi:hypothetical protein
VPLLAFAGSHSFLRQMMDNALPGSPNRAYRLLEHIDYNTNGVDWDLENKVVYHYPNPSSGRVDSLVTFQWDDDNQEWVRFTFMHYHYNTAGRITSIDGYIEPAPGFVYHIMSTSSVYDNQNRLIHHYMYMYSGASLVPFMRLHLNYSGQSLASISGWFSDNDDPYFINTYEFDGNGRIIVETGQDSADSTAGSWVNSMRTETSYHPNDQSNGATVVEYFANMFPGSMGGFMYFYAGMPLHFITSNWSERAWTLSERDVYSWQDVNNRLLSIQTDNRSGDTWVPYEKDTFSYDGNGNISQVIESEYETEWLEREKHVYTWQTYSVVDDNSAPAISELKLNAYPMPFSEAVNISLQSPKAGAIEVNIFNLKGQQIQAFKTLPGQNITWNGMDMQGRTCASGIYFVKAKQNNAETALRIVKLK